MSAHGSRDTVRQADELLTGDGSQFDPFGGIDLTNDPGYQQACAEMAGPSGLTGYHGSDGDGDVNGDGGRDEVIQAFTRGQAAPPSETGSDLYEVERTPIPTALTPDDFADYKQAAEKAYDLVYTGYKTLQKYGGHRGIAWDTLGVFTTQQGELEGFDSSTVSKGEAYQTQISNRNAIFKQISSDADGTLAEFAQHSRYMKDMLGRRIDNGALSYREWKAGRQSDETAGSGRFECCVPPVEVARPVDILISGENTVFSRLLSTFSAVELCDSQLTWAKTNEHTIQKYVYDFLRKVVSDVPDIVERSMKNAEEVHTYVTQCHNPYTSELNAP